ncbi:hypothetical protein MJG53_008628 [Ovis ammon polii x Ovis aries]|uniref:Uncharacterized protein n=2 Tax=Ovis TaxID=9935 RepID=A0A836D0D7_SHEEP|nr:hypothetical protein JEQ12_018432 [Ovis aries]KAI4583415.1 hypothetical protein MJG53_008628 [Ovis ammon polii x Ovis aries]
MQGTPVQSLLQEDLTFCGAAEPGTPQLLSLCPGTWDACEERVPQRAHKAGQLDHKVILAFTEEQREAGKPQAGFPVSLNLSIFSSQKLLLTVYDSPFNPQRNSTGKPSSSHLTTNKWLEDQDYGLSNRSPDRLMFAQIYDCRKSQTFPIVCHGPEVASSFSFQSPGFNFPWSSGLMVSPAFSITAYTSDWVSNPGSSVVFQANNMKVTLGAYPDQKRGKEEEKSKSHEADNFPFPKLMVYLEKMIILSWKCNEVGGVVKLCLLNCKVKGLAHVRTSKLHTSGLIKIQLPQRPKQSSKSWVPTIIFFNDTVLLIYFGIKGKASRTMDVLHLI